MCPIATVAKDSQEVAIKRGGIRDFISLFLPLLGTSCCNYLFLFVEKILLARVSSVSLDAAISAMYACQIFQGTCMAFGMMAQVFVARWYGEKSWGLIGPGIWQFIWFSLLSMLVTVPLSLSYADWYFSNPAVAVLALPYFQFFVGWNFLYPLTMVLVSFYLGRGKTKLVFFANLMAQGVKLGLAIVLIFGWGSWIPAYGIMGGAISTVVAQGSLCLLLFLNFLRPKYRLLYRSHEYRFHPTLFFACMKACLSRAFNRVLNFTSWASIAHLMVAKGGLYIAVLSMGGTIFLFASFIYDAICQTQVTIVSQLLGERNQAPIEDTVKSAFKVTSLLLIVMAIPCLIFPLSFCSFLFPSLVLDPWTVKVALLGIWICFCFYLLNAIPLGHVLACKDLRFPLVMGCMNWVNGYLLMYCFVEILAIPPHLFWGCLALMHGTTLFIYLWRMRILHHRMKLQMT